MKTTATHRSDVTFTTAPTLGAFLCSAPPSRWKQAGAPNLSGLGESMRATATRVAAEEVQAYALACAAFWAVLAGLAPHVPTEAEARAARHALHYTEGQDKGDVPRLASPSDR